MKHEPDPKVNIHFFVIFIAAMVDKKILRSSFP